MSRRNALSDAQRKQFAGLIVLDRVISEESGYHAALMESEDDTFLEPVFGYLQGEDLVEVGEDDRYRPTDRGREAYGKMIDQRRSYLAHFEIFARVDLAEGTFGDPNDPYDDPRWSDLRVAVGEYKGIDPYRIVFPAMLSDETFFRDRDWKVELALGSNFFAELEEIVHSQIAVEELGYEAEDGEQVSGEAVIEDLILQGARENRVRWEKERDLQKMQDSSLGLPGDGEEEGADPADGEPEDGSGWVYVPYDPWSSMAMYAGSALFVEAMWIGAFW